MTTGNEYVRERRHAKLSPGESAKMLRELHGLSQSELARRSGIPQPALSAFEHGTQELGLKRIKALALALRVHPAVIAFPDWEAPVVEIGKTKQARSRSSIRRASVR
jgi:transcriptional regulator with XRE-family HTH domain